MKKSNPSKSLSKRQIDKLVDMVLSWTEIKDLTEFMSYDDAQKQVETEIRKILCE